MAKLILFRLLFICFFTHRYWVWKTWHLVYLNILNDLKSKLIKIFFFYLNGTRTAIFCRTTEYTFTKNNNISLFLFSFKYGRRNHPSNSLPWDFVSTSCWENILKRRSISNIFKEFKAIWKKNHMIQPAVYCRSLYLVELLLVKTLSILTKQTLVMRQRKETAELKASSMPKAWWITSE